MAFGDSGELMEPSCELGLAAAARAGSFPAFLELVRGYQRPVYRVAYALTRNWSHAESLAADVFARAWVRIGELAERQRFLPWVFSLMRDVSIPAPPEDSGAMPNGAVLATFAKLPIDERLALSLRILEKASYDEIATCLEVSPVIAALRLAKARGQLLSEGTTSIGEDV